MKRRITRRAGTVRRSPHGTIRPKVKRRAGWTDISSSRHIVRHYTKDRPPVSKPPRLASFSRRRVYVHKREGMMVDRTWAKKHPRSVKTEYRTWSNITNRWIPGSIANKNWRLQAIRELARDRVVEIRDRKTNRVIRRFKHRVSIQGAKRQLQRLGEINRMSPERKIGFIHAYSRWFEWLYEHQPYLMPESLNKAVKGELSRAPSSGH